MKKYKNVLGPESLIEPLIENGADIKAINGDGDTALILAIESGNLIKIMPNFIIAFASFLKKIVFCCRFRV